MSPETIGQILPAEQLHTGSSQQQHPMLARTNLHLWQEGQLSFKDFYAWTSRASQNNWEDQVTFSVIRSLTEYGAASWDPT